MDIEIGPYRIERAGTIGVFLSVVCIVAYFAVGQLAGTLGPYESGAVAGFVGILATAYLIGITPYRRVVSWVGWLLVLGLGVGISLFSWISLTFPQYRALAIFILADIVLFHTLVFWIGFSVYATDDTPPSLDKFVFAPAFSRLPTRFRPSNRSPVATVFLTDREPIRPQSSEDDSFAHNDSQAERDRP